MSKTLASFLVFLDTIGISIALLGGNTWLCLLMGIATVILYVKVNPILFGDYDRKRKEKIEKDGKSYWRVGQIRKEFQNDRTICL
ncbi:hypothetical protein Lpp27_11897 [Lacticaseibacillus paracasei subsp. paracasei CNCM I-4648]|nr:hypothetical protein Lpp27_11897 [Lacticaseibacillus paracasei subsp. paracasei CNCM I-4648]QWA32418.1 hypothetical protein KIH21_00705 [Lacticaseibacillus paracasei subsp. paracasei]